MNNKKLLLQALKNEETSRAPWVPFVGVHGGNLINVSAKEYLSSGKKIAEGVLKAVGLYNPDGIPVTFDLQMEAEVLGCEINWVTEKVPPSVVSHPLENGTIKELPKFSTDKGRFPEVKKALKTIKEKVNNDIAIYGLITGPFTLALHLMGTNLFMDMITDPEKTKNVLKFCVDVAKKTSKFYIENGVDVIAVVDPMTSQISPDHFAEFVTPNVNEVFDFIKNNDAFSSLFVCGNATRNLEEMCKTNCDNISIDENISLEYLKELSEKYNKSFGGNLKLTSVLLFGDENDCRRDAINCIDIGGTKGFILAPGCDLPYDCPQENIVAVSGVALDDYQRKIARRLDTEVAQEPGNVIDLHDYKNGKKLIIEIVTLDSDTCPPCKYMVDAVKKATSEISDKVGIYEYKISEKEGLVAMQSLKVRAIPTICLNGKVVFSSIIPDIKTLQSEITKTINKHIKK